ncbi:tannase/feruloyl esterase family alpha/beta hydrolase [Rhizorhabdus dicambivorans]|uniref:Tannase/feruloyl esterase family alpha/beta hydrolase n=1 Tax=Rhizorhabdus dicambivorans TaxID=1850238 RepID=A0A2A4FUI3_9SPHN|nr:tannase/feruloyl esterase family alpha/beta hydrolase [Rhizorhabdus dicambivorans]ATE64716.1 tannase/feruloyl esterase family alpha/beta hydrolase [Rhizorhabdus dicambivorans]PCE41342.1 tannase/feruloyl esterase family alpha/beta hydrolase [Rhizorhabdus dicambivorans]
MRLMPLAFACLAAFSVGAAPSRSVAQPFTADRCAALKGLQISAAKIGLPTQGAEVVDAVIDEKAGSACIVSGRVRAVDPKAPDIQFQVALPGAWNGKAMMLGGGGQNGVIPVLTTNDPRLITKVPSPFSRGYAVFGSDSGHQGSPLDGSFALNDEAYRNWFGDALKKTRDVSMRIIRSAYGRKPERAYFIGRSTGGREALTVASRWPADWDGVVSMYPARNVAVASMARLAFMQALSGDAWIAPPARVQLLKAANETCDGLDGLRDGVIGNLKACRAIFDPATAKVDGQPLRCAMGATAPAPCLTDKQIALLKWADAPLPLGVKLANGEDSFPGINSLTSDLGIPDISPVAAWNTLLGLGLAAPASPLSDRMPIAAAFADSNVKYSIVGDGTSDWASFDVRNPGKYLARLNRVAALDALDTQLGAFAKRGGKVLMIHGDSDLLVSPRLTERYYENQVATLGQQKVDAFLRFYMIPGFGHSVSSVFLADWDAAAALEAWVERGVDPRDSLVMTDMIGKPGRTRPMCRYPAWPKYRAGDPDMAASFVCATE